MKGNQAGARKLAIESLASGISNPQLSNVSFAYGYTNGSSLIASVTGPAHTVTNTWETTRDVLANKENKVDTTVVSSYGYNVNHHGQRTGVDKAGTAFGSTRSIGWGYNSKGEVVKADSSITGLDRAYQYDGIGNRLKSADSLTLPTTNNYTPNALNQYTALTLGSAGVSPAYDDDGNMTSGPLPADVDSASDLVWDAENRLISATVDTTIVTYLYDSQSRRISTTTGGNTTICVYDGWNPIAEYSIQNSTFAIQNSFTWGTDLSGSLQGAGGVGGLLVVTKHDGSSSESYFPTYDGNGNISEYLDDEGAVVAHYEYDPFGRETVSNGTKANDFAHRFSTKQLDSVTGLLYYGYRWMDPASGRWPSRDPIEEMGGLNLYGFVRNNGVNKWDLLGMVELKDKTLYLAGKAPQWGNIFRDYRGVDPTTGEELYDYRHDNKHMLWIGFAAKCATISTSLNEKMFDVNEDGGNWPIVITNPIPTPNVYLDGNLLDDRHKGDQMTIEGFTFTHQNNKNGNKPSTFNIGVDVNVEYKDGTKDTATVWLYLQENKDDKGKVIKTVLVYTYTGTLDINSDVQFTTTPHPGIKFTYVGNK